MEIVLLILAGVVVYYLYVTLQEYLKNPLVRETKESVPVVAEYDLSQDPYVRTDPLDKVKKSEYGIMTSLISKMLPKKPSLMQQTLVEGTFEDMKTSSQGSNLTSENLREIFDSSSAESLEELSKKLLQATYGEYKKRLKFIEFLFVLLYAEGKPQEEDKENLIDVAAFLQLDNEDFNKIHDEVEAQSEKTPELDENEALKVFGLQEGFGTQELSERLKNLVCETKQNAFDPKNLNKSLVDESFSKLREIARAYGILSSPSSPSISS